MSLNFYLVLHFIGIFGLLLTLGGMCLHVVGGGTRANFKARKWISALHGVSLLIILVAGFGMLARMGLMGGAMPGWVVGKLVIWLLLGASPAIIYRKANLAGLMWFAVWALAGVAAFLGVVKP